MLIAFVGAPIAGKTTTAARLFADLKEQGLAVEFMSEYARFYIAAARESCREAGAEFRGLTSTDQYAIMLEQSKRERVMTSDPTSIVIADSLSLSALLYMKDEPSFRMDLEESLWTSGSPISLARQCAKRCDIIFRCSPVRSGVTYDPNRLHSYEQSLELDKHINTIFDMAEVDRSKVYPLFGDTKLRVTEAASVVMRKVVDHLKAQM